jgi:hypothetical protein
VPPVFNSGLASIFWEPLEILACHRSGGFYLPGLFLTDVRLARHIKAQVGASSNSARFSAEAATGYWDPNMMASTGSKITGDVSFGSCPFAFTRGDLDHLTNLEEAILKPDQAKAYVAEDSPWLLNSQLGIRSIKRSAITQKERL